MPQSSPPPVKSELDLSEAGENPKALAINRIDCIELYTGNMVQSVFFLKNAFGFAPFAYRGPLSGHRETEHVALKQGEVRLILSAASKLPHPISDELSQHGFTVKDIALEVPDCVAFFQEAVRRGAEAVEPPAEWSDQGGSVRRAQIKTYGNVVHSLVERKEYSSDFWPGYVPYDDLFPDEPPVEAAGIRAVDHVVGNVEQMDKWVSFYEEVLGFKEMLHFSDEDISTEYSSLMSKVMNDGSGKIKFPINEPAEGKRKSQIEEYLEFHGGPGVQHIAMAVDDIIHTVAQLQKRGVRFLRVPKEYYDEVPERVGALKEDLKKLAELGILVDQDDDGYLLQIFTKPITGRPTLFFEIIQREGSQGFGKGNFKALFEAIEREQESRGNL